MKKILIVEDHPPNRELAREFLEGWGFDVVEAHDGVSALKALDESAPDLVLMDIQMPKQDGYSVIKEIRQRPKFRQLPVVAITALAMRGDEEKAIAAGFDGYQTKPLDFPKLKSEIRRLLNDKVRT